MIYQVVGTDFGKRLSPSNRGLRRVLKPDNLKSIVTLNCLKREGVEGEEPEPNEEP